MEQPLSHRACAKLGRANDAMDGHHQHVEQDESNETKRIPSNVIRHCLEAFAEVAAEFKLKSSISGSGSPEFYFRNLVFGSSLTEFKLENSVSSSGLTELKVENLVPGSG